MGSSALASQSSNPDVSRGRDLTVGRLRFLPAVGRIQFLVVVELRSSAPRSHSLPDQLTAWLLALFLEANKRISPF